MVIYEPFPMIPLTELHEELRFEYPDLPAQLFDYYLTRTAVDMAERGNLIRRRVAIELEPGVTRYALRSPDGLRLWAILGIWHSNCGSLDCDAREVRRSFSPPHDAIWCGCGDKRHLVWWDVQEQTLHVNMGCHGGVIYVTIAVVPDRKTCELPKVYQEEYLEALLMGTRSAIMLITGRPWTNLRLGGQLRNEYLGMVQHLAGDALLKQQRGVIKMNFGRAL